MMRYLQSWIRQLRWQRLTPFEKLADMRCFAGVGAIPSLFYNSVGESIWRVRAIAQIRRTVRIGARVVQSAF
jgi:hypothetical protein